SSPAATTAFGLAVLVGIVVGGVVALVLVLDGLADRLRLGRCRLLRRRLEHRGDGDGTLRRRFGRSFGGGVVCWLRWKVQRLRCRRRRGRHGEDIGQTDRRTCFAAGDPPGGTGLRRFIGLIGV